MEGWTELEGPITETWIRDLSGRWGSVWRASGAVKPWRAYFSGELIGNFETCGEAQAAVEAAAREAQAAKEASDGSR